SVVLKPGQNGFTLSCYAISGTGDNSGIIYAWYYWQKSNLISGLGEWKPMGVETKGRVTDYRTGIYSCVVSDSLTGKSTCSDIVAVGEELVFVGVKETIRRSNTSRFELSFKGGCAPYNITVFLKYGEWTDYGVETTDMVYFTDTIYSEEKLKALEYDLDANYIIASPSNKADTRASVYYAVVTDAIGNSCESTEFYRRMNED
ncbi:MAG: hypothetical protein IK019_08180, partial [Clostridia bacterium]|nr:hypothetical protein [Clostridia bacterium]